MKTQKPIIVVGGYGAVGRYIVADLHHMLPKARIIVAGRSLPKAQSFADTFDDRVTAATVDVTSESSTSAAFAQSSLVILNTEAGAETAARICIEQGISLITVAASVPLIRAIATMHRAARAGDVALVTEVGLAPGLLNLMAHQIMADQPDARFLDLVIQLAMAGDHGPEAMAWTIARSNEAGRAIALAPALPKIGRWVIPVDFVDREKMAGDLKVETVTSSLALMPAWSSRVLPYVAPFLARHPRLLAKIAGPVDAMSRVLRLPFDSFNLVVRARAQDRSAVLHLRGQNQSRVTGRVAAMTAARLVEQPQNTPRGVVALTDIVTFDDLGPALEDIGCTLTKA